MKFDHEKALTRAEVLKALKARWEFEKRTERVPVGEACGRVLAQDCHAAYDLPRHRVSSFDGIAVRSAACADGRPDTSTGEPGRDYVRADTGDDFPDAYDAVTVEEVRDLAAKCERAAENWAPVADEIWARTHGCAACAACKTAGPDRAG